jgi:3-oxoacyl-[acyl-carrier-protein] synthase-3
MKKFANITGWGKCLPPAVLTNSELETITDTSDEWIRTRTGICERRISHTHLSDLCVVAGSQALAAAGLEASELDLIILATATPDSLIPNAACRIQAGLKATNAAAFDMNAACSGFIYALSVASAMVNSGLHHKVLVIGGERLSFFMDWTKRETAVLFGDGAGAAIIEASDTESGLVRWALGNDFTSTDALFYPGMGTSMNRYDPEQWHSHIQFDGRIIFKKAIAAMALACEKVLREQNISLEEVDLVIPHQANRRIIDALAKRLEIPDEKVFVNIEGYGNTSAATIPVAIAEAVEAGRIKPGSKVLISAFGAGLSWAAGLIIWGDRATALGTSDAQLCPNDKTALELLQNAVEHNRAWEAKQLAQE